MEMVSTVPSQTSLPTHEYSNLTKTISYKAGEDGKAFQILQILRHIVLSTSIRRNSIERGGGSNRIYLLDETHNQGEEIFHVFILHIKLMLS